MTEVEELRKDLAEALRIIQYLGDTHRRSDQHFQDVYSGYADRLTAMKALVRGIE